MVIWAIECDEIGFSRYVTGETHEEVVGALVRAGFKRMLKDDCPYQDEPLVFEDTHGRTWDAMPETINQATDIGDWALFANAYDAPNNAVMGAAEPRTLHGLVRPSGVSE